jgi:hypothetical protein
VRLDASGSSDPDGDALTYTWTGVFGTLTGPVVSVAPPVGDHLVTLTVRDGRGGVATDTVNVAITDDKLGSLSVALSTTLLSPADGRMVNIIADVRAFDRCDKEDVFVELVSIVATEDAPPFHVDDTSAIQGAEFNTGDMEFALRAALGAAATRREYKVVYRTTDKSGNSITERALVIVEAGK